MTKTNWVPAWLGAIYNCSHTTVGHVLIHQHHLTGATWRTMIFVFPAVIRLQQSCNNAITAARHKHGIKNATTCKVWRYKQKMGHPHHKRSFFLVRGDSVVTTKFATFVLFTRLLITFLYADSLGTVYQRNDESTYPGNQWTLNCILGNG